MNFFSEEKCIAKPFLKWAGGKTQLLNEIEKYYIFDNNINKFAEPFVGGGAVLFDVLNKYDLEEVYISDINLDLIDTYLVVKNRVDELLEYLIKFQSEYINLNKEERNVYYIQKRERFNYLKVNRNENDVIEKAAIMIFLNKTCFNGLFRVNKKGLFNVPIGDYKNPLICDEKNIINVSKVLKKVKIIYGDYKNSVDFIDDKTFVYFDPPYRPISKTSNFISYTEVDFNDDRQIELSNYVNFINKKGAKILISNSDPKNYDENDNFFENIYSNYKIKRIEANRMINSRANSRGKIKEILISNF